MAIYSLHVGIVKRSNGHNAVQAAAYNSRSKLILEVPHKSIGEISFTFDYSKKGGLAYSKIFAPKDAPGWVYDRQKLWNKAETMETRVDSRTARKFTVALPIELTHEQNVMLVEEFCNYLVEMGMVVDANIHNDKENNPHMHIMATTRKLETNRYGQMDFAAIKCIEWNKVAVLKYQRELWADLTNRHLHMHGFDITITDKSYKDLGIDLIPGVHEGPARNIKNAELAALNREIAAENARRIIEKPSLIIDKLVMNKPVFTKEEMAIALEKVLYEGIEFNKIQDQVQLQASDNDSTNNKNVEISETVAEINSDKEKQVLIESFHKEMTEKYVQVYTQLLASPELSLVTGEDLKGRELYTSTKRIELEERFTETIEAMYESKKHTLDLIDSDLDELSLGDQIIKNVKGIVQNVASLEIVRNFIKELEQDTGISFSLNTGEIPPLSKQQRSAVLSILNGENISILEGIPGSGKTTAMREIVRQYKKAGYKVIGVAPSSAAALQLAKATGIESKNASLWRKEWLEANGKKFEVILRGDYYKEKTYQDNHSMLTRKTVMIIDEASMGELANMDYLLNEARKVGSKVLLVGDDNQFSAVGFAGALKKAIKICGSNKLTESRRQQNPIHREATKLLGQYEVKKALDIYDKEGSIIIDENIGECRHRLVKDYIENYIDTVGELKKDNLASIRSMVICTYTNAESQKLNHQIRDLLKEAGVIKGREQSVLVGDRKLMLARGEQIVFTRNFNKTGKSGIYNGEVGTIVRVSKPNKLGDANIGILVHKANGSKEGIVLRTKDFDVEHGNLLDYGYAVTGYKLQGSTVDKTYVLHEKQMGYEAFNVAMTRHRIDVRLYSNKEDLRDVMYESLDIDSKKAQLHYNMIGSERDIALSGLVKLTHKRVNNSFASDYYDMGLTTEDKHLKAYIEANLRTTQIIQKISVWQQKEFRLKGVKPNLWDHTKLWYEFKEARDMRNSLAVHIKLNYETFKDRLIQLNMNFSTIIKHAQIDDKANGVISLFEETSNKYKKYLVEEQQTTFYANNKNYELLIESIGKNEITQVKEAYNALKIEIADVYSEIQETDNKIKNLRNHESEIKSAISIESNYREILLPSYLRSIYRPDSKDELNQQQLSDKNLNDGNYKFIDKHHGHAVLKKYEELVEQLGYEEAAKKIGNKPSLIGKLEGIGIGRFISINSKRKDAVANVVNLERQLLAYSRSVEMEKRYKDELINNDFTTKIMNLQQEIELLKKQLPMSIDKKLLDEVEDTLEINKTNISKEKGIDLLRKSDTYASLQIRQLQGKTDINIVEIDSTNIKDKANVISKISNNIEHNDVKDELKVNEQLDNQDIKSSLKNKLTKNHGPKNNFSQKSVDIRESFETNNNQFSLGNNNEVNINNTKDLESKDLESKDLEGANNLILNELTKIEKTEVNDQNIKNNTYSKLDEENKNIINKLDQVIENTVDQEIDSVDKPLVTIEANGIHNKQTDDIKINNVKEVEREKQTRFKKSSLDFEEVKRSLNSNIIEQLFRQYVPYINADGKIIKKGNELISGSIHLNLQKGLWFRFSGGVGGDIFSLIKQATSCSTLEAFEIVAQHTGVQPKSNKDWEKYLEKSENNESLNNQKTEVTTLQNKWTVFEKVPHNAPKFNPKKDLAWLQASKSKSKFIASYEYRNNNNKLLGYTVRLEEVDTGKKSVIPLSYAHNQSENKSRWQFIGFNDHGYKPIYGIEKLKLQPLAPILIVEGEKTANAAQKLFKDHIVLSWLGGTNGVDKVDWSQIKDRFVVVWPDNDKVGIHAANIIKEEIDYQNGFSGLVSVIDTKGLKLPEKWDLADELPSHLDKSHIITLINDSDIYKNYHKINQINQTRDYRIIDSIEMLVASGRMDKDKYVSKEMYNESLQAIANNKGIRFDELTPETFTDTIISIQDEYRQMQEIHDKHKLLKDSNKQDLLYSELIRDASIMCQSQLNMKKLTKSYVENIEYAVKNEISKIKYLSSESDKDFLGNNIYRVINNDEFIKKLENENTDKISTIKLQLEKNNAKTFEELLPILNKELNIKSRMDDKSSNNDLNDNININGYNKNIIDALVKNRSFLIKNDVITEKQLFETIKNSKDIALTVNDIFEKCKDFAIRETSLISDNVRWFNKKGQEDKAIEIIEKNKTNLHQLIPYLKNTEESKKINILNNRLALELIINKSNDIENIELIKDFKVEVNNMYSFEPEKLEKLVDLSNKKGIRIAMEFAITSNSKFILEKVTNRGTIYEIVNSALDKQEYTKAIAKESRIMKYIDSALNNEKFNEINYKDELIEYTNERDIELIFSKLNKNQNSEYEIFKNGVDDMHRFSDIKNTKEAITLYQKEGSSSFNHFVQTTISKLISCEITNNLDIIKDYNNVKGFDGNLYKNKDTYLNSIINDNQVIKYVPLESEIGKIIAKQVEKNKQTEREQQANEQASRDLKNDIDRER